ncbi:MAG: MFS transporter [Saprospiraceae bacterium]|nr:MFS transporter [Saprospiraceae bacterium]MDG2418045.1 MFS transporter [Saprospiraceae bacterium]
MQLGLKNNWQQFSLLVLINAFVGGMVGLERSILPSIAEVEFSMAAKTIILSFIVVFGITKATANFFMGKMANKIGRRRLLILGWLFGLPVPFVLMFAPSWNWIIFANVLLGINQGLAWSSTVIMKIDLVGQKDRGLAMGINEFAGYLSVGIVAFLTSWIADNYGLRPYPFYIGIGLALAGFLGSIFLIRDTQSHLASEEKDSKLEVLKNLFWQTSILHPNLGSISQAGLINNLNDGMVWGLLPLFLITKNFGLDEIGIVVGVYPAVWGLGQLVTGKMGDFFCKKDLLFWGMFLQAIALVGILFFQSFSLVILASALLGWGTAMVYPNFISAIADSTHPSQRAESIGVFRMWRDLGYAIGALLTGVIADFFGMKEALVVIILLTVFSSMVIQIRMTCDAKEKKRLLIFS